MSAPAKTELNRPFSCDLCAKRFTRSENLKRHVKQHSLMKFICPHCEKGYSRNDSLKSHIRRIHASASLNGNDIPKSDGSEEPSKFQTSSLSLLSSSGKISKERRTSSANIFRGISKPGTPSMVAFIDEREMNLDQSFTSQNRCGVDDQVRQQQQHVDQEFNEENDEDEDEDDIKFPLDYISRDEIYEILDLYWYNFDPTFPILHKSTFSLPQDYSRDILINVICSIGLRYYQGEGSAEKKIMADDIYSYCIEQLENALNNDFTIKYFQAALIAVYAGLFSGNDDWYKWSINNHFQLVSLARENGMFQYNANLKINDDWNMFIICETRKRISYGLYFIDGQMATLFNYPPKLSHYEIKHILPCSETVWDSKDYETWALNVAKESNDNILSSSDTKKESGLYFLDGLQQTLVHGDVPKPISSFGGVVILLAIHIMIRNMAQYSGILDQNQPYSQDPFSRRSQLGQALNGLRGLIPKRKPKVSSIDGSLETDGALRTMWDFFEADWNLAYIHLHLPDTVITSGIVEVTLDATIATAAALSKPQLDLLPGTVLLSNDYTQIPYETYALVNSHILFFLKNFKHQYRETNPAFTFMFYKGCLVAWQILKASSTATSFLKMLSTNELLNSNLDRMTSTISMSNLEMKKEFLQKEYMMKRLADDILGHIDTSAVPIPPPPPPPTLSSSSSSSSSSSTTLSTSVISNSSAPNNTKMQNKVQIIDPESESYNVFNKWVESLLFSYDIWGMGKCASISFTEMLSTS